MNKLKTKYIISQLAELKVHDGPDGQALKEMDYQSLRSLLAIKRVVQE